MCPAPPVCLHRHIVFHKSASCAEIAPDDLSFADDINYHVDDATNIAHS